MGCVMGTEVTKEHMEKYISARWKQVVFPIVTKIAGVFLFQFQNFDDMLKILDGGMNFVFDKPFVLK